LPVVASAVGQINDLLAEDRGALIPIGDSKQMATSIHHFFENPEHAQDVGQRARQWVLNNATWKIRAAEILEQIKALP
jgi:glycosyltransferase involved in cell wall biosynthesis